MTESNAEREQAAGLPADSGADGPTQRAMFQEFLVAALAAAQEHQKGLLDELPGQGAGVLAVGHDGRVHLFRDGRFSHGSIRREPRRRPAGSHPRPAARHTTGPRR